MEISRFINPDRFIPASGIAPIPTKICENGDKIYSFRYCGADSVSETWPLRNGDVLQVLFVEDWQESPYYKIMSETGSELLLLRMIGGKYKLAELDFPSEQKKALICKDYESMTLYEVMFSDIEDLYIVQSMAFVPEISFHEDPES